MQYSVSVTLDLAIEAGTREEAVQRAKLVHDMIKDVSDTPDVVMPVPDDPEYDLSWWPAVASSDFKVIDPLTGVDVSWDEPETTY